ncbi:MAG: energy transducer TonB [Pseudomonadota bacterium]
MRNLFMILATICLAGLAPNMAAQDLDITEIASAKAAYDESQTDARRAALLLALDNYQGDATVETVNAHLIVMTHDTVAGRYADIRESAMAAAHHLEPVKEIIPQQYIESKFVAATALFNGDADPEAMREMTHVQGFAKQFRSADGEHPDWAVGLRWKAEAWVMAMDSFFESERDKHPSSDELDAILDTYPVTGDRPESPPETVSALPFCDGRIRQSPKMRYPGNAAEDGVVGAVIVAFDLDADGKVINPKVRAAIPNDAFEDTILKTISKWSYRADKRKEVGVTCRIERTNVVMPFTFLLK